MVAGPGPSGLLVVDKPGGVTSHDVVARARRILGTRKVGHAGTLDPMATGVLVLGVGRATRLLGHLTLTDKEYSATIRLGRATVTDDAEGEVIMQAPTGAVQGLDDADLVDGLRRLTGTVRQRPSAVSAVKVAGRRAYDLVRQGEDVDLPERTVVISRIDVGEVRWAPDVVDVDVDVACSSGTYIRAIARDLGEHLGVGGHLTALRRTRVGPFALDEAVALDDLEARGAEVLLPMTSIAARCFPLWEVRDQDATAVVHGRRIPWSGPASATGPVAIVDGHGRFLAVAAEEDGLTRYLSVLAAP